MSGPALRKADSHHLIHLAAAGEGTDLTMLAKSLLANGKMEEASRALQALCEHWRESTLEHAREEEADWYLELMENEDVKPIVLGFRRDHFLMERFVMEMEHKLQEGESLDEVVMYAEGFLKLVQIHSDSEEKFLTQWEEGVW